MPKHCIPLTVPDGFEQYKWSDGGTTNTITIKQAGTYWLRILNEGCSKTDTVLVDYHKPEIYLGNDTLLCIGTPMELKAASTPGSSYIWSNGSREDHITVSEQGRYWVTAINQCGAFSDTVSIDFQKCICTPFIPSAFTPNGDGKNDDFSPILDCAVTDYKLIVVNRFGEAVFKTNNPNEKWDGHYKSMRCEMGVYFYMLQITGPEHKDYLFKGDLALLR